MLRGELLMALAQRQRLAGLNETAGAVCVFLEIHCSLPGPYWLSLLRAFATFTF